MNGGSDESILFKEVRLPLVLQNFIKLSAMKIITARAVVGKKWNDHSPPPFVLSSLWVLFIVYVYSQCGTVDDKSVLHIALQDSLIGDIYLVGGDQLNVAGDAVPATEIQHVLCLLDTYKHKAKILSTKQKLKDHDSFTADEGAADGLAATDQGKVSEGHRFDYPSHQDDLAVCHDKARSTLQ